MLRFVLKRQAGKLSNRRDEYHVGSSVQKLVTTIYPVILKNKTVYTQASKTRVTNQYWIEVQDFL